MDPVSKLFGCVVALLLSCLCVMGALSGGAFVLQDRLHGIATPGTAAARPVVTVAPADPSATGEAAPPEASSLPDADPAPAEAHDMLALLAGSEPPTGDRVEQVERLQGKEDIPRILAIGAAPIPVGTRNTFNLINLDTKQRATVSAELRYATPHVYFWAEEGLSADDESIRKLIDLFEEEIYPRNRAFFGSEDLPGIDGDPHLYILFARRMGNMVGGYFSSADSLARAAYLFSNEHEMFYMNADTTPLMVSLAGGILAHEFQHMIQWAVDPNEETWLNEGFAMLAMKLNGFEAGGFDRMYVRHTETQLNTWPPLDDYRSMYHYGGVFLFVEYFLGRFGEDAARALIANPLNGLASVDDTLRTHAQDGAKGGAVPDADDVMADFAVALLLSESDSAGTLYAFPGYEKPPVTKFPRDVTVCPAGAEARAISQFAIDYIRMECAGTWHLAFAGQTVQKVVAADPPEGSHYAWSNRGDQSDMTLTRAFALPADSPATLRYSLWFDVEEDYDYGYLEISLDGGSTWETVRTPSSTSMNLLGNNLGYGWSGISGGGDTPEWVEEEVDLSPYAGERILLRFEYLTDSGQNQQGFLLDNIRIPEIGYATGFEDGLDGWDAEGFVRLRNMLPQTFRVQLVRFGSSILVEEIRLDDRMRGDTTFDLVSGEYAVLVVVPTTRHTTQTAEYWFEVAEGAEP